MLRWAHAMRLPTRAPLVLVFVNIGYWSTFVNWLVMLAQHVDMSVASRVGVVCLDSNVSTRLKEIGAAPCFPAHERHEVAWDQRLSNIWSLRLLILRELLVAGYGVILSDADALWMTDARTYYYEAVSSDIDVVSSRANFPPIVNSIWGATLCMGFIVFRPSVATALLLEHAVARCGDTCDDQTSVNDVLLDTARLRWNPTPLNGSADSQAIGVGLLDNQTTIRVRLLSSREVPRWGGECSKRGSCNQWRCCGGLSERWVSRCGDGR